jgi:electron transport complex protein RnfG
MLRNGLAALGLALLLAVPASVPAGVIATKDEALARAFPGATISRRTGFLSADQQEEAARLSSAEVDSRMVVRYQGTKDGREVGTAYFDKHLVRTLPEVVMTVVAPDGRVTSVEILAFAEPKDYLPQARWLKQFQDKSRSDDLRLKRDLRGITGATLSSRAVAAAVRRSLVLDQMLRPKSGTETGAETGSTEDN